MAPPLRNPGCLRCIYCKAYYNTHKRKMGLYCLEHASVSAAPTKRRWRWINCENALVKNRRNYCQAYKRFGIFLLKKFFWEKSLNAKYRMETPALAGDKFWKT